MQSYFQNQYDPTDEDIKKVFPDHSYGTKESWLEQFEEGYSLTPKQLAEFALNKLIGVTTSFRLEDSQKTDLETLAAHGSVNGESGFVAYCDILTPKQMSYVGF